MLLAYAGFKLTDTTNNPNVDGITQQHLKSCQQLMQKGQFREAIKQLEALIAQNSSHSEPIYYLAVCQRKLEMFTPALASLERLLNVSPEYDRAFQERGYVYQSQSRPLESIPAFEKAVEINPALLGSWRALANEPSNPNREIAKRHVQWLSSLPRELVSVTSLIHNKKLYKAEQLCRHFLKQNPHHPEAMRLLAELGVKFQILDDAEFLLESCVEFEPDFHRARLDYVVVLHKRQKFDKALEQAQYLHNVDPKNIGFQICLGNAQQASGNYDLALQTYSSVLDKQPSNASIHLSCGHTLKTMGQTDNAIVAYQKSYAAKPDFGDAYWSLANLKTYRFSEHEITQMQENESNPATSQDDRAHLSFALGKAQEDIGDYESSFKFYNRGNALKDKLGSDNLDRIKDELDHQKLNFDAAFFESKKGRGCQAPDPIFIVGLPRAGSTLLEQILASHSMVDGTMELANVIGMAHRLGGRVNQETPRYPSVLNELSPDQLKSMGEHYINDTQHHRTSAPFFIDKMPNNFRHIALIQLILPNAKIIDARREPMACCFSGFKQLFSEGQEFSYSLASIGEYYRRYVDIMSHWEQEIPGKILRVQHEDVIENLEEQVRRMLKHCGLSFEQNCVDFHKNKRAVRTPSSEQVRQPIYKSGMDQWKNFEPYLDPLKQALGSTLHDYK